MQIKNVNVYGLNESCIASGYPMQTGEPEDLDMMDLVSICDGDNKRAKKLANTPVGSGHNNFLKGIIVQFDMKYPQYWTKQFQRYHWFEFVSSQSLMHKLTSVSNIGVNCNKYVLGTIIDEVNTLIEAYNDTETTYPLLYEHYNDYYHDIMDKNEHFHYIISNLPMGYELWGRFTTNYLQIKNIVSQRKTHKIEDWHQFVIWIKTLPLAEELIFNNGNSIKE